MTEIGLVAEGFDPAEGGAARVALALGAALAARGHAVTRIGPPARRGRIGRALGLAARAEAALGAYGLTISCGKAPAHVLYPQGGLHLASLLASAARHGRLAGATAAALKLLSPRQWVLCRVEERALRRARLVLALSRRVRADLVGLGGVDPARIALCPNGAPARRVAPPAADARAAARRALGVEEAERALLFVSHNWRLRGLDALLGALARAPAATRASERLVVAGRGPAARYEERARRLGVRLLVVGAVPEVLPLYHAADALVLPTRFDPCSLVTLEAMAAGLPVLTTDANGAAELWEGDEGVVVPLAPGGFAAGGDPLAEGLERLRGDEARRAMGRAARATAEAHDEDAALARAVALCERAAAEGAAGSAPVSRARHAS